MLAILLPITSMRVWWDFKPETPENRERIIIITSPFLNRREAGGQMLFDCSLSAKISWASDLIFSSVRLSSCLTSLTISALDGGDLNIFLVALALLKKMKAKSPSQAILKRAFILKIFWTYNIFNSAIGESAFLSQERGWHHGQIPVVDARAQLDSNYPDVAHVPEVI